MSSSNSRRNSLVTFSNVYNKAYERERKSITDVRRTEAEFQQLEQRYNDKIKWKERAERNILIKGHNQNVEKLSPSIDEYLEKSRLKRIQSIRNSIQKSSQPVETVNAN